MFDTVLGLPVHILVIHAVVVLGPLAGLTAVAYALRPGWRRVLRWPLAALAALAAASSWVAVLSGEALLLWVFAAGAVSPEQNALIQAHTADGSYARWACLTLLAATLVAALWAIPPGRRRAPVLDWTAALALVGAGLWTVVQVVLAGHSGSEAVWLLTV
jgi:hypothetical protein